MGTDELIIWISLLLMSVGYSFHRMGPSFERGRFGFPLILLGLTCLVLFPDDLAQRERELHTTILGTVKWVVPYAIGSLLILRFSPTYGESTTLGLVLGWIIILLSCAILFSDEALISFSGAKRGLLVLLGILTSLLLSIFGISFLEGSSGLRSESEPLLNEEESLVRAILERNLGGDESGN